jgi:hypothetical protein
MLTNTNRRLQDRGEEGAALATMVFVMVVIFLALTTITVLSQTSIAQTVLVKSSSYALTAAESGQDAGLLSAMTNECERTGEDETADFEYGLYRSSFHLQEPTDVDSFGTSNGCPEDGDRYLLVESVGTDKRGFDTEILSIYRWGDGSEETVFDSEATQRAMPTLIARTEN